MPPSLPPDLDLFQFLTQFKVNKDGKDGKDNVTHTGMGRPMGSFDIPPDQKDTLMDLLYDTLYIKKQPVNLVERPMQHTIIKADLDFKYQLEESGRRYTTEHIRAIVELYHRAIRQYLDVPNEDLRAFVFERDAPYKDRGNIKDGIHIMYPYLICDTQIQHLIREHVLLSCQPIVTQLGCKNVASDVVDKSIISSNGWLMYGCSKPNVKPYKLTHIYDVEFNDLNIKKYDNKTLIRLLSIRDHDVAISKPIKPECQYLLETKKPAAKVPKRAVKITRITNLAHSHMQADINLDDVRELVQCLSAERADDYKTWVEVGFCLRNINVSLLDSWIEFSRQSKKFREGECEDVWSSIDVREDGLGIGSLHRWAEMDDKKKYDDFSRSNVTKDILKSQSQTTQDVAKVVHTLYKYKYKCTSVKHGVWYEFQNHRWAQIDSGVSLKKKIGNDVVNEYLRLISYYNQGAYEQSDDQKDQFLQKSKYLTDITYNLRDYNFKEKIMKECQIMFYDSQFETQLDGNPDLIGFENGVYDLKMGEFRDGRPEDNVSLSTGNDYIEFKEDDELIVAIHYFLSQVFPDPKTQDYVLTLLASFLEGRNPNEKFHIWTGVGGNGKSKLLELFELAFGRYTGKIPVTVLTQKTKGTSNQANPEVARLKGLRTVSTQEPEENERFNVGVMKDWTGGDRITCRPLYRDPFDFKPQFKMVFCCNHLPSLPPDDEGTWRRVSVVEFKARFVDNPDPKNPYEFKKDTHLTEKLHLWKEAFMYILVEYYKQYRKQGLVEPDSVKEATREYQRMNDAYKEFIDNCIEKDTGSSLKLADVYKKFKDWWREANSTKPPDRKEMKASLEKKLGKYVMGTKGGWRGYRLISTEAEDGSGVSTEQKEIVINTGRINEELK